MRARFGPSLDRFSVEEQFDFLCWFEFGIEFGLEFGLEFDIRNGG